VDGDRVSGSTPTISGKGRAGETVSIRANDAAGNLLLSEVATGAVDSEGNYEVNLSTALTKGDTFINVNVGDTGSDITGSDIVMIT